MKKKTKKTIALLIAVLLCIAMMVVPAAAAVLTTVFTPEQKMEAKNAESGIPYAAAEPAHDPDPMVKLPDGMIGRRSELMARDKH